MRRVARIYLSCENSLGQPEGCENLRNFYDFKRVVRIPAILTLLVYIYIYIMNYDV